MPVIDVTLIEGRSEEAKSAFIRAVTDATEATIGVPREAIRIMIREIPATHFAAGGVTIAERTKAAGG